MNNDDKKEELKKQLILIISNCNIKNIDNVHEEIINSVLKNDFDIIKNSKYIMNSKKDLLIDRIKSDPVFKMYLKSTLTEISTFERFLDMLADKYSIVDKEVFIIIAMENVSLLENLEIPKTKYDKILNEINSFLIKKYCQKLLAIFKSLEVENENNLFTKIIDYTLSYNDFEIIINSPDIPDYQRETLINNIFTSEEYMEIKKHLFKQPSNIYKSLENFISNLLKDNQINPLNQKEFIKNLLFTCNIDLNSLNMLPEITNNLMEKIKSSDHYKEYLKENIKQQIFYIFISERIETENNVLEDLCESIVKNLNLPNKTNDIFVEMLINKGIFDKIKYIDSFKILQELNKSSSINHIRKEKTFINDDFTLLKNNFNNRNTNTNLNIISNNSENSDQIIVNYNNFDNIYSNENFDSVLIDNNMDSGKFDERKIKKLICEKLDEIIIQLVKLKREKQNDFLEEKFIIEKQEILKLVHILGSDISLIRFDKNEGLVIDFEEFKKYNSKFYGIIGRPDNIMQSLVNFGVIDKSDSRSLESYFTANGNGIYMLPYLDNEEDHFRKSFILVIWNTSINDYDKASPENNLFIRLLRYFTQLCTKNIISIDNKDLSLINFKKDNKKHQRFFEFEQVLTEIEKEKCEFVIGKELFLDFNGEDIKLISSNNKQIGLYTTRFIDKTYRKQKFNKPISTREIRNFLNKYQINYHKISFPILSFIIREIFPEKITLINTEIIQTVEKDIKEEFDKLISEELNKIFEFILTEEFSNNYKFEYDYYIKNKNNPFLSQIIKINNNNNYSFDNKSYEIKSFWNIKSKEFNSEFNFFPHSSREALLSFFNKQSLQINQEIIIEERRDKCMEIAIETINNNKNIFQKITSLFSANGNQTNELIKRIEFIKESELKKKQEFNSDSYIDHINYLVEKLKKELHKYFNRIIDKIKEQSFFQKFQHNLKNRLIHSIKENLTRIKFIELLSNEFDKENKKVIDFVEFVWHQSNSYSLEAVYYESVSDESKFIYSIYELVMLKSNENLAKNLIGSIELYSDESLIDFIPLPNGKNIILINHFNNSYMRIISFHNNNYEKPILNKQFGKRILKYDYDESSKIIAFYSKKEKLSAIVVYYINENNYTIRQDFEIDLFTRFGIENIKFFRIDGNKKFVWVVDENNTIWKIFLKSESCSKSEHKLGNIINCWIIPECNCFLIANEKKEIVPILSDNSNILPKITIENDIELTKAVICSFNSEYYFVYLVEDKIKSYKINTSLSKSQIQIKSKNSNDNQNEISGDEFNGLIYYFFYIYDKFPIINLLKPLENQNYNQEIICYLIDVKDKQIELENKIKEKFIEIENKIEATKKQNPGIDLSKNLKFIYNNPNKHYHVNIFNCFKFYNDYNLGQWLQELICFIPIQIARAENNQFLLLTDGVLVPLEECHNAFDLKGKISLGLYEGILNSWKGPIKVISSMGKQSTGKSYTLNHLSGSSFAISGARCTDGCWLTMKVTEECLYIILDFEGLGSFERTDQEDMMLSIFNAAISNVTLFKTEYRLDKEIDQMFNRFNSGSSLLKGSDKIFNGYFTIIIKDVPERDIRSLLKEFTEKINLMINKEKEKNFIKILYKKGFNIFPFPSLESREYYSNMEYLKDYVENKVTSIHNNGKEFLDLIKLILAKMAISDFTSLNRQEIELRIKLLNDNIDNALKYGCLSEDKQFKKDNILRSYDDISKEIDERVTFNLNEIGLITYLDTEIELIKNNHLFFIEVFNKSLKKSSNNHLQWHILFSEFTKLVIKSRLERIKRWIETNLEKWKDVIEFQDLILGMGNLFSQKSREIEYGYQICKNKCNTCNALCTKPTYHDDEHFCESTSHLCEEKCYYCQKDGLFIKCKYNFGHEGEHICFDKSHLCGLDCKYKNSNFCDRECNLKSGHEGDHQCSTSNHKCKLKCSLPDCDSLCELLADFDHTIHKCVKEQCTRKCEIKNCNIKCCCKDHFHGTDLSKQYKIENGINLNDPDFTGDNGEKIELQTHICGNIHQCEQKCEIEGYCKVSVERKIIEEEYLGKRGTFKYKKQFLSIGEKLNCIKSIEPFKLTHEGNHSHSLNNVIHQCEIKCPTCENICDKPYGHVEKHSTDHGNMTNCYFIANQEDLDIGDHKYVVGESSIAEMCNFFCKSLGRGHIHILECDSEKGKCSYDPIIHKRRHQTCTYGPNREIEKDEIWHDAYWDMINFEDPCAEIDKEEFNKCPYYCSYDKHKEDKEVKNCELELWHPKIKNLTEINKKTGLISYDGHYFSCSHSSDGGGYHFILALDDSGSMSNDWNSLCNAVIGFVNSRINYKNEKLTIIQYNNSPIIMTEYVDFKSFDSTRHLVFRNGGTSFGPAISLGNILSRKYINDGLTPVFIFMSDGESNDGDDEMQTLYLDLKNYGLLVYTIAFGHADKTKLSNLANIAKGHFLSSVSDIDLRKSFLEISSSLGTKISVLKSFK